MDLAIGYIYHLWDRYLYYLDRADARVADWLLMQAYWPTLLLTCFYLLMVYAGMKIMKDRRPLPCHSLMLAYNIALVALNVHIFYELFTTSRKLNYNWSCQPVDYTNNPDELRIARALWWYYISKLFEFLDTMFFIARKKNSQVTFLHVYHHATMFPIWWIGIKWVPGGQSVFGATINSFIHIIMYLYYCLSALGPAVQKFLWWKKYLTILQLIQFVTGMTHAAQSIYVGCPFPLWMQWALIIYGTSIFILFINFYLHAYIKPNKRHGGSGAKPMKRILSKGYDQKAGNCNGDIVNGSKSRDTRTSNGSNINHLPSKGQHSRRRNGKGHSLR